MENDMAVNQGILRKYQSRLESIPAPGGNGCHTDIMGIANLGVIVGLSAERIFLDIRDHIPHGQRFVHDREIWEAINKALADHGGVYIRAYVPKQEPIIQHGIATLQRIIQQATITDEVDLWEASPIRLWEAP
jgi:hypothetical protein